MNLILSTGDADVNMLTSNEERMTPLHIATFEQHLLLVKMLLQEFKADVDCMDYRNNTPLHYAVNNGNLRLVKIILTKFPRIDIQNFDGLTALQLQMK
jgi:ankyrin repeat protein